MDPAPNPRPWIVMVTGEPGSGKTTLGRALGDSLRVPFLSRDDVRAEIYATAGLWTNDVQGRPDREAAVEAFVQLVEKSAALGVSTVLELVIFPEREHVLHRLEAVADCLVVLTTAADAPGRVDRRVRADPLLNRREVLDALGHASIDDYLGDPQREIVRRQMLSTFDLPQLTVRTDDGYELALADVIEWVIGRTRERSTE